MIKAESKSYDVISFGTVYLDCDFSSLEAMIYANEIKNPYVIVGYFLAKQKLTTTSLHE